MTSSPNSIEVMLVKPLKGRELAVEVKLAQFVAFHFTLNNPVHPEKELLPIEVTDLPIITLSNPLQPLKALLPMETTASGITSVPLSPLQLMNTELPIEITWSGMTIVPFSPLQLLNA